MVHGQRLRVAGLKFQPVAIRGCRQPSEIWNQHGRKYMGRNFGWCFERWKLVMVPSVVTLAIRSPRWSVCISPQMTRYTQSLCFSEVAGSH